MKWFVYFLLLNVSGSLYAKEWKSLKNYQKATQKDILSSSDWLKLDRLQNTLVWQAANTYNLNNNLPHEYTKIVERRDFYKWIYKAFLKQGHEVVWTTMAHFISKKLCLMETFPYSLFLNKKVKQYANVGSEIVFNNAFKELKALFNSKTEFIKEEALLWDERMLYKEQYLWIDSVYKTMDARTLKTIERIAKGKFLYALAVPKKIRYKGDIFSAETRYNYAVKTLRVYCKTVYQ